VFQLNLDSFCDLCNEWIYGMVLINSLKHSKTYIRFNLGELWINIDEHEVCCYYLVSVDFESLLLIVCFILLNLCLCFQKPNSKPFLELG
jgi:hypothetical protein